MGSKRCTKETLRVWVVNTANIINKSSVNAMDQIARYSML